MQGLRENVVLRARRDRATRPVTTLVRQAAMPLPHSTCAERIYLSGLLKEWKWLAPLTSFITVESFYNWHHRMVFRYVRESPGPYGVYMRLIQTGEYREWPDLAAWIAELWEVDPTGCNGEYAASVMRRLQVRREIIVKARELIRDTEKTIHAPAEYERILTRLT